ncbi:MAG: BamA/TamA family outer membrane protein [Flavobacteriales bacterium]|nr:BamA/TamA family outer membrane protein [Flavobacteriales bacterium]
MRIGFVIILVCCWLISNQSFTQSRIRLDIIGATIKLPSYPIWHSDTLQVKKTLSDLFSRLHQSGYIIASVDSIQKDSVQWKVFIHTGRQFRWASVRPGNARWSFLKRTGFREKIFFKEPIKFVRLQRLMRSLFKEYENNGYPFAIVQLDSLEWLPGDSIQASILVNEGPLITFDSILVNGKGKVAPAYLHTYLGIRRNNAYNESVVRKIETRLKELPFVRPLTSPVVEFLNGKARIKLELDKRNANQFSGFVGLVPQNDVDGGFLITGDVRLRLQNLLKRGELADIQWQRLQTGTQNLNIQLYYPFLFNLPLGIDGKLNFFRVDTSFFNVNLQAGLAYLLKGTDYLKFFYQYQTSRKILPESGQSTIAGLGNTDINMFGIASQIERLDYRINPRKGFSLRSDIGLGNKSIFITPGDTVGALDSNSTNLLQLQLTAQVETYIPFLKRFALKLGARGGWIYNQQIFRNELFRLGGLQTLRGFDDESLYASAYGIGTLEIRFLLEENSYINLFTDAGWYERTIRQEIYQSYVVGFGGGITFNTKIGMFSVNYALGTQKDIPVDFRRSKIHLGYINFF